VVLNLSSGIYYGASDVGARIWTLALNGKSQNEIADVLSREFDVTVEQASNDVQAFLADLESRNLLTHDDS
jgi:hypothetical protein